MINQNSQFYYQARVILHKKRWLLRSAQIVRGWWILGPFRHLLLSYHRRRSSTQPLRVERHDLFPQLDVMHAVDLLNEKGYVNGVRIPDGHVNRIVRYVEDTRLVRYRNPHRECEAVDEIARNDKLVEVARRYLGAEPILWLTDLKWSFGPDLAEERGRLRSSKDEPIQYDSDAFHYDTLDFKSLTAFIYLTDVDASCGPHVVIENTHGTKTLAEICNIILGDSAAQRKFGHRIKMILGERGNMLLEDTSSFHKASKCRTKRLMLTIHYVLQRTPPPERPVAA
jgi:hypothetical protein